MVQQLLSVTVTIMMLGSVVYFVVGFILSVRDRVQVDPLVGADVEFLEAVTEAKNPIDVKVTESAAIIAVPATSPVKVAPTVRKDICHLASSLGVARAYNRKTEDLLGVLRSEFGYA